MVVRVEMDLGMEVLMMIFTLRLQTRKNEYKSMVNLRRASACRSVTNMTDCFHGLNT
jgi:hypothetical protein